MYVCLIYWRKRLITDWFLMFVIIRLHLTSRVLCRTRMPQWTANTIYFWLVLTGKLKVCHWTFFFTVSMSEIFPRCLATFTPLVCFCLAQISTVIFTIQTATSNWTHPLAIVRIVQGTSSLKPPGRSSYSSAEIAFDGGTSPCASVWSWDIGILWFMETWTIMNLRTVSLHQEWIWNSC